MENFEPNQKRAKKSHPEEFCRPARFEIPWRQVVVCPQCRKALSVSQGCLTCHTCGKDYPILPGDIPSFTDTDSVNSWKVSEKDWLIKFGFTEGNKCYKNAYSFEVLKTDFYLRPSYQDGFYWGFNISDEKLDCELNDVKPLKYVHELQNLFFAITGTELELKHECSTCI